MDRQKEFNFLNTTNFLSTFRPAEYVSCGQSSWQNRTCANGAGSIQMQSSTNTDSTYNCIWLWTRDGTEVKYQMPTTLVWGSARVVNHVEESAHSVCSSTYKTRYGQYRINRKDYEKASISYYIFYKGNTGFSSNTQDCNELRIRSFWTPYKNSDESDAYTG